MWLVETAVVTPQPSRSRSPKTPRDSTKMKSPIQTDSQSSLMPFRACSVGILHPPPIGSVRVSLLRDRPACSPPPAEVRNGARGACHLEDVHAGVCAIHDIDVSAVVHLDVIGLDGDLAPLAAARLH